MIHVAVLHTKPDQPTDPEVLYFASVDGESYLPINREPEAGDEEAIAALFEPEKKEDGSVFAHMRWAKRCFNLGPAWFGEWVTSVDQYTVG